VVPLEIRLCDPHSEALDLFHRVAQVFSEESQGEVFIHSTSEIDETLSGAGTVILCFGLGRSKEVWEEWLRLAGVSDPGSRPAMVARAVLLSPVFSAVNEYLAAAMYRPTVINLVRPIDLARRMVRGAAHHLDWPAPLPDWERVPAAHSALRLVMKDAYASHSVHEHSDTPFVDALLEKGRASDGFDGSSIVNWLEELESAAPGKTEMLLGQTSGTYPPQSR
jgi:hypothetical protein